MPLPTPNEQPGAWSPPELALDGRLLAGWAMDLLSLRRRGLLNPSWERLAAASQRSGPARPPARPTVNSEQLPEPIEAP